MAKKYDSNILKEIKRVSKINGQIRTVNVEIDNPYVAEYAIALDNGDVPGQKQNYHFSDGDGSPVRYFEDTEIKASIDGIVSGKRRPEAELDKISENMARMSARHVIEFLEDGAHMNYQWWKGTNDENLIESGRLRDSIVGVVYKKGKEIYRGR